MVLGMDFSRKIDNLQYMNRNCPKRNRKINFGNETVENEESLN